MPSLIHLNGPPGIGKSTLAALYADRHPGTLNLDMDTLHPLVGGWRNAAPETYEIVRVLGLAMATAHLAGGRDVVLPQFLARIDQIERFERVAQDAGAGFLEIVLLDGRAASVGRFERRRDESAWGRHNREVVASAGGPAFLEGMYDQLVDVLRLRPAAVVVETTLGAVDAAYASLDEALAALS